MINYRTGMIRFKGFAQRGSAPHPSTFFLQKESRIILTMKKVIILLGPTAVGKTKAAILLARHLGTEIISADSMQVYRHMDIGTAKPSQEELKEVRHHMIDIIEPSGEYSAGRYVEEVVSIVERLLGEGKTPLFVGGTGLYIKAMTKGLFSGPRADAALRGELKEAEEDSPGTLYSMLKKLDPEAASSINPSDKRRLIRALEVCLVASCPATELKRTLTSALPFEFVKIGITRERAELYRLIDSRVDEMMKQGLLDEVKAVLSMGPSKTAMQAIGYKEMAAHLAGLYPLEEAVRLVKRNSKRYAKRQFTWFKKEENVKWVDVTGLTEPEGIFGRILKALGPAPAPAFGS
jgi:tRNA dimethylallyltransferase